MNNPRHPHILFEEREDGSTIRYNWYNYAKDCTHLQYRPPMERTQGDYKGTFTDPMLMFYKYEDCEYTLTGDAAEKCWQYIQKLSEEK